MNYLRQLSRSPFRLALAALGIFLAIGMFFANPCAHLQHTGIAMASAGVLTIDPEAQQKVIKGVESLQGEMAGFKTQQQKILDDFSRTDKEVKKAAEDVQKLMTNANEQALLLVKLQKLQEAVLRNARSSFGDPIKKTLADDGVAEYMKCIVHCVRAKAANVQPDPGVQKIIADHNSVMKSLTGVDAGLGQATVPQATFNVIYDTLLEYGQWNTLGVQRVGMRTNIVPLATARPVAVWIGSGTGGTGEGSTITAGNFSGTSVTGIIQTLAAYITVSRELLADSTVDLAPYVLKEMTQSVAYGLDAAAFNGTGNADQISAGYYGLFNLASLNANCAATSAQGNTTVGGTQIDDWVNVILTVNPVVLARNPKWWMHPQMVARALLVRDKNGRPIFQTWMERPDLKSLMSILGFPVILTGAAPNTDGPGNPIAAYGDPDGQAVLIREDLELATSDDINFAQNMRAFRTLLRAGVRPKTLAASTTLVPLSVLTLSPN